IPATLSAISHLAKRGVLFKGGVHLSNVSDIRAVAFDKTGTLTTGRPVVTETYFKQGINDEDIKLYESIIVAMESKSNHPLAQAIINHYHMLDPMEIDVENIIGVGLVARYKNQEYKIGKPTSIEIVSEDINKQTEQFEHEGKTVVYFGTEN